MLPYLLMITMLLVAIIMLNALIAIMGDTYDRVSERRLEWGLQGKALVLIEIEYAMTKDEWKNPAFFPRWLHVIKRAKASEEGGAAWSGRMRAIKDSCSTEGLRQKLDGIEGTLNKRVGAIETQLTTIIAQLLLASGSAAEGSGSAAATVTAEEGSGSAAAAMATARRRARARRRRRRRRWRRRRQRRAGRRRAR